MADRTRSSTKASSNALNAIERQVQAVSLRKRGYTFQQIADELGYAGHQGAYKAVMAALKKTLKEPSDELRNLELERLDAMWQSLWPAIERQDKYTPRTVEVALKVMDRRAALLGLDAPQKREDKLTVEYRELVQEMAGAAGLDTDDVMRELEAILGGGR